jgi:hypothetical protein
MYWALVALKLSRQHYNHKEDNLLDTVAYIGALNNYIEEKAEQMKCCNMVYRNDAEEDPNEQYE